MQFESLNTSLTEQVKNRGWEVRFPQLRHVHSPGTRTHRDCFKQRHLESLQLQTKAGPLFRDAGNITEGL